MKQKWREIAVSADLANYVVQKELDIGLGGERDQRDNFETRLADGPDPCSGRVEINYKGVWGGICHRGWDMSDAEVVCGQLGCGFAQSAPGNAYFAAGETTVWLDSVQCNGTQAYLWECRAGPLGQHSCSHQDVASVVCADRPSKPHLSLERDPGAFITREMITMTCTALSFYAGSTFYLRKAGTLGAIASAAAPHGVYSVKFSLRDVDLSVSGNYTCQYQTSKGGHSINSTRSDFVAVSVTDQTPVRLVNGRSTCSGRVEVYYGDEWGVVCDDNWDIADASVVCRQLGCGDAHSAPGGAHFGSVGAPVWLDDVQCNGTEATLMQCPRNGLGDHNCSPSEAASVICTEQFHARLKSGGSPCSGRVEILYNGVWSTVCDDGWDMSDAEVVCTQLRCGFAASAPGNARFGEGASSILLESVQCNGSEVNLWQCPSQPIGQSSCGHHEDASVTCSDRPVKPILHYERRSGVFLTGDVIVMRCTAGSLYAGSRFHLRKSGEVHPAASGVAPADVHSMVFTIQGADFSMSGNYTCFYQTSKSGRFANSTHSDAVFVDVRDEVPLRLVDGGSACSGRPELRYRDTWGSICDRGFDMPEADVLCRQLGCGPAKSAPGGAHFGEAPAGAFWLDQVECQGNESNVFQCRSHVLGEHSCSPGEAASVVCSDVKTIRSIANSMKDDHFYSEQVVAIDLKMGDQQLQHNFQVRLANGDSPCSGRVEIYYNHTWGTVCDGGWDLADAEVACAQAQCGFVESAPGDAKFGQGNSSIWLDSVQCTGSEAYLWQCPSKPLGRQNCKHQQDASAICSDRPLKPTLSLGMKHAALITRDTVALTCTALIFYAGSRFYLTKAGESRPVASATDPGAGHSITFVIPDVDVSTSGNYTCHYQTVRSGTFTNSSRSGSVHVLVTGQLPMRLVNGRSSCSGRVEIEYEGRWGAVCDDGWDLPDASVACRQLGCGPAQSAPGGVHFGAAAGSYWLGGLQCNGNETTLVRCPRRALGEQQCDPGQAASVTCSEQLQVRLVNGGKDCAGRVEIYYNGTWGTVCDDDWDMRDAEVVCRQLQCGFAESAPGNAKFGEGNSAIWLDDVQCKGSEGNLWQCQVNALGQHNCNHNEDASVVCTGSGSDSSLPGLESLYQNDKSHQHFLKRCPSLRCLVVRSDANDLKDHPSQPTLSLERKSGIFMTGDPINMTCKASSVYKGSTFYLMKAGEDNPVATQTAPGGAHSVTFTLWGAGSSEDGDYTCHYQLRKSGDIVNSSSSDSVHVYVTDEIPIRLTNGTDLCSGRVEVFYNDSWWAVCEDRWDVVDAAVVCGQLGCGAAQSAPPGARFGPSPGPLRFGGVQCSGAESSLLECPMNPLGQGNCTDGKAASVICSGPR
ncbi:scavenger receptor cysteine-rich type 1 protein M130-like [Cetorhinus maximus]